MNRAFVIGTGVALVVLLLWTSFYFQRGHTPHSFKEFWNYVF